MDPGEEGEKNRRSKKGFFFFSSSFGEFPDLMARLGFMLRAQKSVVFLLLFLFGNRQYSESHAHLVHVFCGDGEARRKGRPAVKRRSLSIPPLTARLERTVVRSLGPTAGSKQQSISPPMFAHADTRFPLKKGGKEII